MLVPDFRAYGAKTGRKTFAPLPSVRAFRNPDRRRCFRTQRPGSTETGGDDHARLGDAVPTLVARLWADVGRLHAKKNKLPVDAPAGLVSILDKKHRNDLRLIAIGVENRVLSWQRKYGNARKFGCFNWTISPFRFPNRRAQVRRKVGCAIGVRLHVGWKFRTIFRNSAFCLAICLLNHQLPQ